MAPSDSRRGHDSIDAAQASEGSVCAHAPTAPNVAPDAVGAAGGATRALLAPKIILAAGASAAHEDKWRKFAQKIARDSLSDDFQESPVAQALALALLEETGGAGAVNEYGETALVIACSIFSALSEPVIRALLEKGADPNACAADGSTPLLALCQSLGIPMEHVGGFGRRSDRGERFAAAVELRAQAACQGAQSLLAFGALPNHEQSQAAAFDGDSPLHVAARHDGRLARVLLNAGARIDLPNRKGETPLWAALRGPVDALEAILGAGADPNEPGLGDAQARSGEEGFARVCPLAWVASQNPPFREAGAASVGVETRALLRAKKLVEKGADIGARGPDGETLLQKMLAAAALDPVRAANFIPMPDLALLLWLYKIGAPLADEADAQACADSARRWETLRKILKPASRSAQPSERDEKILACLEEAQLGREAGVRSPGPKAKTGSAPAASGSARRRL